MNLFPARRHTLHRLSAAAATIALSITAATLASAPALAQDHSHGHAHGAAAPAKLSLDKGHRWATDEALRKGMGGIRALVEPAVANAHAGKLGDADAAALAGKIEGEVGGIVANCKLEPKADAMLHLVIAEIGAGTDAMKGKTAGTKPEQGLVKIVTALNDYSRYFEHRGFKPIHTGH